MKINIKNKLRILLYQLPFINSLVKTYVTTYPPGHYYSPIISENEVRTQSDFLFNSTLKHIPDINLNEVKQLEYLQTFKPILRLFPFNHRDTYENWKYNTKNGYFGREDAAILYSFILFLKPNNIIEIGSGYSSALMMDVNENNFSNLINLTFIEPFPDRLYQAIGKDKENVEILEHKVQNIDLSKFEKLGANDILFIDSSHVSKTGSDLNYIIFHILPALKSGVYIHFHDIFYPFEYPQKWVTDWFKGFGWNEVYLIRAFLMNNSDYEICFFNSFMAIHHQNTMTELFPGFNKSSGCSLWLKKR